MNESVSIGKVPFENRSEIAIRALRAATELGLKTVSIRCRMHCITSVFFAKTLSQRF